MSKKLDHDVLKQTTGLLSQIDKVLSEVTVAERVERVLSSAAPQVNFYAFPSIDDWVEWHKSQCGDSYNSFESSHLYCGSMCGCGGDMIERNDPFEFVYAPWQDDYRPVDGWCRPDCACAELYDGPASQLWVVCYKYFSHAHRPVRRGLPARRPSCTTYYTADDADHAREQFEDENVGEWEILFIKHA